MQGFCEGSVVTDFAALTDLLSAEATGLCAECLSNLKMKTAVGEQGFIQMVKLIPEFSSGLKKQTVNVLREGISFAERV